MTDRVKAALREIGRSQVNVKEEGDEGQRRLRLARLANAAMAKEGARRSRLRNVAWASGGGLAACAALLLALWIPKQLTTAVPDTTARRAGTEQADKADKADKASILVGSGARVTRSEEARFHLASEISDEKHFEVIVLDEGAVSLVVPKLKKSAGLAVLTPEARVEVRGTDFTVERDRREATTFVAVREGLVSITHQKKVILLHPGGSWSSAEPFRKDEASPTTAPVTVSSGATSSAPRAKIAVPSTDPPKEAKRPSPAPTPEEEEKAASDLAEQTRLYQAAMVAKRHGLTSLAEQRLKELTTRFPASPLAPSAERELQKLKSGSNSEKP